jgi:hypothetical protein
MRRSVVVVVCVAALVGAGAAPAVAATQASSGCATTAPGDTNGDGRSDPLIGVPGKHSSAGQVDPFVGTSTGIRSTGTTLSQGVGGVPGVSHTGNQFGLAVVTGDVNGDGCSDAAISAPGDRFEPQAADSATHTGSVTVLYGRLGVGTTTAGAQMITAHTLGIEHSAFGLGTDSQDLTIQSLGHPAFGDFNGDGFDDLALIDTVADEDADVSFPSVIVVPGTASGLELTAATRFRLPGADDQGHFGGSGISLATGDLRGDGYSDLVIAEGGDTDPAPNGHVAHGDPSCSTWSSDPHLASDTA